MPHLKKILHIPAMDSSVNTHESVLELLIDERILVDRLIKAGQVVYGANTLVGHKDGKAADPGSLLNEILKSHLIGFGVSHTAREVAFIARARILSWQAKCPLTVLEDGLAAFIESNLSQSPGSLDDVFSRHSIQNKHI